MVRQLKWSVLALRWIGLEQKPHKLVSARILKVNWLNVCLTALYFKKSEEPACSCDLRKVFTALFKAWFWYAYSLRWWVYLKVMCYWDGKQGQAVSGVIGDNSLVQGHDSEGRWWSWDVNQQPSDHRDSLPTNRAAHISQQTKYPQNNNSELKQIKLSSSSLIYHKNIVILSYESANGWCRMMVSMLPLTLYLV